jgi:hypothetical protein
MIAVGAALVATGLSAQEAGDKQIKKLSSRAGDTIASMRAARLELGETLDGYNQILDGEATDNRAAYKQLQKALAKSEKSAAAVGTSVGKMEEVAAEFFSSWESSLAGFSSDDLRARSEERMKDTRKRYDGILAAASESREAFGPFVTQLKDQILFLGHDLNPSALEALAPDAKKLNEQADKVFARVDKTIETAGEYRSSLAAD